MLLPALSNARAKARAIACTNNQKGYGLFMMMYANDHSDFVPFYMSTSSWAMQRSGAAHSLPWSLWKGGYISIGDAMSFRCPNTAVSKIMVKDQRENADELYRHFQHSYGLNINFKALSGVTAGYINGKPFGYSPNNPGPDAWVLLNTLKQASRLAMAVDNISNNGHWLNGINWKPAERWVWYGSVSEDGGATGNDVMVLRHNKRVNILWADGHCESLNRTQVKEQIGI